MTVAEIKKYYADLLILQYRGKPKAYATIEALVELVAIDNLPFTLQDAFNVSTAIGVQLDVLGKYANVSRYGFDLLGNAVTLTDTQYRAVILIKVFANQMGSSLADIQAFITAYFPAVLQVFDYKNMHMSYFYLATLGTNIPAEFYVRMVGLPRPLAVQDGLLTYAPVNNFFGFQTYELQTYVNHGFNTYSAYDSGCPFLVYSDALVF